MDTEPNGNIESGREGPQHGAFREMDSGRRVCGEDTDILDKITRKQKNGSACPKGEKEDGSSGGPPDEAKAESVRHIGADDGSRLTEASPDRQKSRGERGGACGTLDGVRNASSRPPPLKKRGLRAFSSLPYLAKRAEGHLDSDLGRHWRCWG